MPRGVGYICGGYTKPGPRDACPNALHDWPLPSGYIEADDIAHSRLYRKWSNRRCPECNRYGWEPGRIGPDDVHVPATTQEDPRD